jgi:hypothetical protein
MAAKKPSHKLNTNISNPRDTNGKAPRTIVDKHKSRVGGKKAR